MAKSSGSASVDPFASAKKKAPAGAKKADANIIVAQDFESYDGGRFTRTQAVEAIEGYCDGHEQFEQGKAMKDLHRPTILALARTKYAEQWLMTGPRPKNPKITTNEQGTGQFVSTLFFNSENKLDENSFATLANLIGAANAEKLTVQRDDFAFNPELMDQTVKVKKDGKVIEQNVMEAIKEALMDKFAPSPEVLANLFTVTPQFHTVKDLIDKGPSLVTTGKTPADAKRLAQFIEYGRFTTQLRVGAGGNE